MTAQFDVAGRLAEGLPAVQDAQTYVWACHLRGYQQPDLTAHGAQVGEWYATEDGLDLGALDADCATLSAAVQTLGEALRLARAQVAELPQAWTGPGAAAAADFLRRHCDSAAALVEAVTSAAQSGATLRDELWRVVDHKVEATAAMVDHTQGHQGSWLAAARAVLAGDSPAQDAAQVIDGQLKPFVDHEIGGQWVPVMRATIAAAGEAYRVALGALMAVDDVRFDIPGDLGPSYAGTISPAFAPTPTRASAPMTPMGMPVSGPSATVPPMVDPLTAPAPAPAPAPIVPAAAPAPLASAPAMPGLGASGEIPARLADALGGLLTPASGPQPGSLADLAEPDAIDRLAADEADNETPSEDPENGEDPAAVGDAENSTDKEATAGDVESAHPDDEDADPAETDEAAAPTADCPTNAAEKPQSPPAPGAEPAPEASPEPTPETLPPPGDGKTPCEIAADELPQAGQ